MREKLVQTPEDRQRFLNEARAVARLRHPNIVGVLREGTTLDDVLWFSMELIQGQSLDKLVPESGWEAERAAAIASDVCSELDCAHQASILHRDIKPANELRSMRWSGDRPNQQVGPFSRLTIA